MTGNKLFDKILILLNLTVVFGAVGLIYYSQNMIPPEEINQEEAFKELKEKSHKTLNTKPIEFNRTLLNLSSSKSRLRFLEIKVSIETFDLEDQEFVKTKEYVVYDAIINIASAMKPNELNSVTGKLLLESRLKNHLNEYFQDDIVKKIYFSQFVIQ